jgi:hypothetical protein
MAKLAMLQVVQPFGVRSTTGGSINQEVGPPPPPCFPPHNVEYKKGEA